MLKYLSSASLKVGEKINMSKTKHNRLHKKITVICSEIIEQILGKSCEKTKCVISVIKVCGGILSCTVLY